MYDPVLALARKRAERLVEDSAAIEVQFEASREWRPVASIMARLRDNAAEALGQLAQADPDDVKLIRTYQNKVALFSNFVDVVREIYLGGIEAGDLLDAEDVEEMREIVGIGEDEEPPEDIEE